MKNEYKKIGKVAYFLDDFRSIGGAGLLLIKQAALMSDLYDAVIVIPLNIDGEYNKEYISRCKKQNLKYTFMEYKTAFNFMMLMRNGYKWLHKSATEIEEFAKKENITFFHSVQLNIAVEYVSRNLNIPHLMNIYQMQESEFKLCPGDIYPQFHLCDSLLYSKMWSNELGIRSRCIRVPAILEDIKYKKKNQKETVVLLMLGGISERKNQLAAIQAVQHCLKLYSVELHIAGNAVTQYAEECKKYVSIHNLEKNVIFHGFVTNIIPLLEQSDGLLCSSIDESFPSSIAEALTYDLTIISTPVAGVPELFIDKKNSFISKDFSDKSIAQSIIECIEYYKEGKINSIKKNANRIWHHDFDQKIIRKQIDDYYRDIRENFNVHSLQPYLEIEKKIKQTYTLLLNLIYNDKISWENKVWYYTFIREHLHQGKMYIWGAGEMGRIAFKIIRILCPYLKIISFVDIVREGIYCGLPVIKPEELLIDDSFFYSVSFIKGSNDVIKYLESKGLMLGKQIWCIP